MHYLSGNSHFPHLITWITAIFIIIIFFLPLHCLSDPRISEGGLFCGHSPPPPPNTTYIPLFVQLMEAMSQLVMTTNWAHYAVNSTNISLYGLAQCHADLTHDDCLRCLAASRTRLPRCLPSTSGRLFLDGCFLRYDTFPFFHQSLDPLSDKLTCNTSTAANLEFGENVRELVRRVTAHAVTDGGHALRGVKGVFGLAECWNTLSPGGCRVCLAKASREVEGCLPSGEGRALNAGCYLRYSTHKFFSNQSLQINRTSRVSRAAASMAIPLSAVAFCMLSLFAAYAAYRRWRKRKQERYNLGRITYSYNKSNLNFKYETLEKATNYFNSSRKLGQGGAGSVYRGTLPNGKTIAVKRLFFSSRQWVDEFFNEVNLISGIEHKHLVKLLGCSIEGPESLLVYEFVLNKSLEHYLFENKVKILNWKERYNIITGTAQGIAFLHEGCKLRIIHRDIKSSNVLLDKNLDPKVADFGLVRCFPADRTHLSTGIAGTLGYMAPEYLVKGQLTEKADVYSFGVLLLEIVCGRKNNTMVDGSESLLQKVWKLYKMERLTESVDPCLKDDFPAMEASKVLRIGLLCVQAHAAQRPAMIQVTQMLLSDDDCRCPEPNQPPFINTNVLSSDSMSSLGST